MNENETNTFLTELEPITAQLQDLISRYNISDDGLSLLISKGKIGFAINVDDIRG